MKRSKKMFTRITSMLHNAVEALAPEMTSLEQFRYHWKCVTQFFLDTTDERVSVESTSIPHHLEQMIQVLQQEEQENGVGSAGASMEYMLQHKLLETMQTLGKADCPPGMKRQVLIFFTNLLGKLRQKLLPHVNVHKPVNKMIRCCGEVKAAPTESEEVLFLLQVSSKLKQDSFLVSFFLEAPVSTDDGSLPPLSPGMEREREKPEYSLVDSLLALTKSEDSRVAIKACEGLLLCTSIPEDEAACVIVLYTAFCERMADQLAKLFRGLPAVIDPADMNQLSATWGFDHEDQTIQSFPGKRQMIAFFSWLDYVNQLSVEAHPMVSKALAGAIRERFILTAIEPGLAQASEPCAITVTAVLTRCLKLVSSATLAQEFADILLGDDTNAEVEEYQSPHKIRRLLIHRINHLSDHLAVETLRLFQALLNLPYQPIIDTLIARNFKTRNYINWGKQKRTEKRADEILDHCESCTAEDVDKNKKIQDNSGSSTIEITEKNIKVPENRESSTVEETEKEVKVPESFSSSTVEKEVKVSENCDSNIAEVAEVDIADNESSKNDDQSTTVLNNPDDITLEKDSDTKLLQEATLNNENIADEPSSPVMQRDGNVESDNFEINKETASDLSFDKTFSKKRIEQAVNGFLLILPDVMKSSQAEGETGYESYLRDAHKQCQQRAAQLFSYDWPSPKTLEDEQKESTTDFYEGSFLNTIFNRLQRMLDQPFDINLEVTAIISSICQFHHPYVHEFLMDTSGATKDHILTLHRILLKVCHDIKNRSIRIPDFQQSLGYVRKNIMDNMPDQSIDVADESFMQGVIVLEEFCKELAAIAFVTATMDLNQDS